MGRSEGSAACRGDSLSDELREALAVLVETEIAAVSNEFSAWLWTRAGQMTEVPSERYVLASVATYSLAAMVLRRTTDVTGALDVGRLVELIQNVQVIDPEEN